MKRTIYAMLGVLAIIVLPGILLAAPTPNDHGIGMVTGPLTGTYIRFGNDIAKVASNYDVNVMVKESKGSIANIKRISSAENAALGIVQSDVLGYLNRTKNPHSRKIAKDLRVVFPFYKEEVHLLANKSVQSFDDLTGKRLVVGTEGSGNWLTSMNLLSMMEVKPKALLRLSPAEGVIAVLKGRADAMIFVGGRPVKLFKNLEDLARMEAEGYKNLIENIHFVPMRDERMLKEYTTSEITPEDYSFVKETVPTVAVTAVMMSYNFSDIDNPYSRSRCEELGRVADAIRVNIDRLRAEGHPKWKEVNLDADVGLWKRDECVQNYDVVTRSASNDLEKELVESITDRW